MKRILRLLTRASKFCISPRRLRWTLPIAVLALALPLTIIYGQDQEGPGYSQITFGTSSQVPGSCTPAGMWWVSGTVYLCIPSGPNTGTYQSINQQTNGVASNSGSGTIGTDVSAQNLLSTPNTGPTWYLACGSIYSVSGTMSAWPSLNIIFVANGNTVTNSINAAQGTCITLGADASTEIKVSTGGSANGFSVASVGTGTYSWKVHLFLIGS
jgi:hypothetical protein